MAFYECVGIYCSHFIASLCILKTIWALGGTTGLNSEEAIGQISGPSPLLKEESSWLYALHSSGIDMTAMMAILASLFALCFVVPLGKKIPKYLIIIPGWIIGIGTFLFLGLSILQAAGYLPRGTTEGVQLWVFILTYGGFFCWGISLFLATLSFQRRMN